MIGWAYMTPRRGMNFYGTGGYFQLPIFPTRKEARDWAKEWHGDNDTARVRKVTVTVRRFKSSKQG